MLIYNKKSEQIFIWNFDEVHWISCFKYGLSRLRWLLNIAEKAERNTGKVSATVTSRFNRCDSEVAFLSTKPHASILLNHDKSVLQLREIPCIVINRRHLMPRKHAS